MDKYYKKSEIELPLIPLRGLWMFPHMIVNFDVGRSKSLMAVKESLENHDSLVILSAQKDPGVEDPTDKDINEMGVIVRIKQPVRMPNNDVRIFVEGICRCKITEYLDKEDQFFVRAERYDLIDFEEDSELKALRRLSLEKLDKYLEYREENARELALLLEDLENSSGFADMLCSYLKLDLADYQAVLDELDVVKRLITLNTIMEKELDLLSIEYRINQKVRTNINDTQKNYYLKEQLQVIKSELGEDYPDTDDAISEYTEKIKALALKEEDEDHLLKEVNRLNYMSQGSPEINVIRTYLDHVLDLPWNTYTDDKIDLNESRKILDRDHYGLKDVKERILEYISVRKLKKDMKASILCLVGPPGVGKTSIVKSVAESMNRNYISMRLGGLGDESEIRGHRKTYIGAMPGRIITSLTKAKSLNPVFLLDEIDKMASDYRGDPASALLEVLDPSQNDQFLDRYIELPIDLSQVMFVTTANTVSTIPRALLDRMEIIQLSGYTFDEKFHIAKNHLLKKQLGEHGLKASQLRISDGAIKKIVSNYTREAGVRNLERMLAKICRRAAMKIVEGAESVSVNLKNYRDYLGRELYMDEDLVREPVVGLVTGLAWTQVGGEILQIEVNIMEGKGKVQLTGSLGNVMKESAMAAISYIRANSDVLGVEKDFNEKYDIHLHVPEGATPKDGPSAGITITTAILSAILKKKVRQDVAMTGEVTIRGRVLPIGGLKEKVLAAKRYGIKTVILPKKNERDLEDIAEDVRKDMKFIPVSRVEEVLDIAIIK